MRIATTAAFLIGVLLVGCDGRVRLLYLKPPTASMPPWSVASSVVEISVGEDLGRIVTDVASHLQMKRDTETSYRWTIETEGKNVFSIELKKDAGGFWSVALIDWPTNKRSAASRKAEEMIRTALKKEGPNHALQPTPGKSLSSAARLTAAGPAWLSSGR